MINLCNINKNVNITEIKVTAFLIYINVTSLGAPFACHK